MVDELDQGIKTPETENASASGADGWDCGIVSGGLGERVSIFAPSARKDTALFPPHASVQDSPFVRAPACLWPAHARGTQPASPPYDIWLNGSSQEFLPKPSLSEIHYFTAMEIHSEIRSISLALKV